MKRFFVAMGWLMMIGVSPAFAGEYFVGTEGKTDNPGTQQAPWYIASALGGQQKIGGGEAGCC